MWLTSSAQHLPIQSTFLLDTAWRPRVRVQSVLAERLATPSSTSVTLKKNHCKTNQPLNMLVDRMSDLVRSLRSRGLILSQERHPFFASALTHCYTHGDVFPFGPMWDKFGTCTCEYSQFERRKTGMYQQCTLTTLGTCLNNRRKLGAEVF